MKYRHDPNVAGYQYEPYSSGVLTFACTGISQNFHR